MTKRTGLQHVRADLFNQGRRRRLVLAEWRPGGVSFGGSGWMEQKQPAASEAQTGRQANGTGNGLPRLYTPQRFAASHTTSVPDGAAVYAAIWRQSWRNSKAMTIDMTRQRQRRKSLPHAARAAVSEALYEVEQLHGVVTDSAALIREVEHDMTDAARLRAERNLWEAAAHIESARLHLMEARLGND